MSSEVSAISTTFSTCLQYPSSPRSRNPSYAGKDVNDPYFTQMNKVLLRACTQMYLTRTLGGTLPQMRTVCTLVADLSRLRQTLTERTGINGHKYWTVEFSIILELGRTQLQARLQWMEGVRRSINDQAVVHILMPFRTRRAKAQSRLYLVQCFRDLQEPYSYRLRRQLSTNAPATYTLYLFL